jgi:pimeloyl-ACP methyl ester carboxylesterase
MMQSSRSQAQSSGNFTTGTVQANGLNFGYLEMGQGPLALALHGFPDLPRTFRYQMVALAAAGYRVVAPYMRGYAPTEVPANGSYESAALAQDALALMDALSQQPGRVPVTVLGHDWGAAAAYGAASMAPERIAKLITMAVPHGVTKALVTNPAQQRRSWYMFFFQMSFAETAVSYKDFAFIERLWEDWSPGWQVPSDEMAALKATLKQPGVLKAALNYYRHSLNPALQSPTLAAIRAHSGDPIQVPTLYIHGANDGCVGAELTQGIEADFAKGLQKHIIPGAGHFVHQEQPQAVNDLILSFLKQ